MKQKVFTVHDIKAEAYNTPFFANTKGLAIRSFSELVNDPKSSVYAYPADFSLFEIGEYDLLTGIISGYSHPVSMGSAVEYKKEPESLPLFD